MNEDKLLIAVNELISAYEQNATESISEARESALNVVEYSNISSIGSVVRGLSLGDFISFQDSMEELANIEELVEIDYFNNCETEKNENKFVDASPVRIDTVNNEPVLKGGAVLKIPKKKIKLDEIDFIKDIIDKKDLEKYDFNGCLNCDLKSLLGFDLFSNVSLDIEPIFRIAELLKNIKEALKEIELSLDPSPLLKNICDLANLWKGTLCPSLIARTSLFFPILIDKNVRGLIDIGFNVGGLIGVIISPILSIGAAIGENVRAFIVKLADCILGAIKSIRDLALNVEQSIQNIYTSINNAATAIQNINQIGLQSDLYDAIFKGSSEKLKEKKEAKSKKEASPEVVATAKKKGQKEETLSFSEKIKENSFSLNKSLNDVFSDTSLFKIISEQKKQSAIASEYPSLISIINLLNTLIKVVEDGKNEVLKIVDSIIYALKAFTVFIKEPIFARIKLIAELKFIFNLIRLISVVNALLKNGFDCSSPEMPQTLATELKELEVDIDELLNSSVKNKRALGASLLGSYKTEVDSYNCENEERARFEKELDSIYNIIEKNF